jgi:GNAT superfamily N-acetyltransferase
MQAFEYNILDFEIVTVAELLQRRPDSAINIMAQLSRHLWAEWGTDFQRYYNIQCPFGLLREFLLTHLEASDDTHGLKPHPEDKIHDKIPNTNNDMSDKEEDAEESSSCHSSNVSSIKSSIKRDRVNDNDANVNDTIPAPSNASEASLASKKSDMSDDSSKELGNVVANQVGWYFSQFGGWLASCLQKLNLGSNIGNPDQTNIGNPDQMKDESTLLHALQEAFKANASISHSLNHPVTFVVYDKTNDAFVGTASLQKDDMRVCMELGGLWLANVYVVPHWRDIGVGRAMCKHALDYARNVYGHDKETPRVHLWTFTEELQDWYARKFGFRLAKIVPEARMNVSSIRVMCLEL